MSDFVPYIVVIWLVFWVYWFTKAFGSKRNQSRSTGFVGLRIALLILVLLLLRVGFIKNKGSGLYDHNVTLETIGFIVFLAGLTLAIWARVYLGQNWGMPRTKKNDPELVTTGPYAYIRHPIYTGILLGMAGTALASSYYWFIAFLVMGIYFISSATVEEKNMTEQFPK
ncbi:MAG TPA: isoprenylcysteine carboxylmethyltransferase family protein, partial [Candidatus Saccharimonadales bacterium]